MRKAIIKKSKNYKFGQNLKKDEPVFIEEKCVGKGRYVYTAFRKENDTLGLGVTRSEFEYTDKEKFIVAVTRISYSTRNIEVEAMDRNEAKSLAIDKAGDRVFTEQNADYEANSVLTSKEHGDMFPDYLKMD